MEEVSSDSEYDEDERSMAITLIRLLMRGGQRIARIGKRRGLGSGLFLDETDDEADVSACCPETSEKFKKSDLVREIYKNFGKNVKQNYESLSMHNCQYPTANIASLVKLREIGLAGLVGSQSFTQGSKMQIKSRLIPNQIEHRKCFNQKLFCGTYSNDGNLFLSACQDRHLRLYTTNNFTDAGKPFKDIIAEDVGWSILDVGFSSDSSLICYSSWSDSMHLIKTFSEEHNSQIALQLTPEQHNLAIFSLQFSASGEEILGGSNEGYLYVYNLEEGRRTARIDAHEDDVNAVCFADKTTNILYSGADDGLIRVWDRRALCEHNPQPVGILAGHRDGITFIDSKEDGRFLLSNSKDQSIKLWDIRKFSSSDTVDRVRQTVSRQSWDYRWEGAPSSVRKQKANIEGDTSLNTYTGHTVLRTLIRARFSPMHSTGQRYIYSGCSSGRVFVYDIVTGDIVSRKAYHDETVRDVHWHPYEPNLMSSSWDGTLALWNYKNKLEDEDGICEDKETGEERRHHPMKLRSRHLVSR